MGLCRPVGLWAICARDAGMVKHGNDVLDVVRMLISRRHMRLIALPMTTRVRQDQSKVRTERGHVTIIAPILDALRKAVLKHQGQAGADNFVPDSHHIVDGVAHYSLLAPVRCTLSGS